MKINKVKINEVLDAVSHEWDMSGHFSMAYKKESLHHNYYGYENREKNVKTNKKTKYLLDSKDLFFVRLAVLILIDQKEIKLTDTLDLYFNDFKHGKDITIKHLMNEKTGIVDYYYNKLMVDLEKNETYNKLSEEDKVRQEAFLLYKNRSFDYIFDLIKECELDRKPGVERYDSKTNTSFLDKIVEIKTGLSTFDFLKQYVFDVLEMTSIKKGSHIKTLTYAEHKRDQLVSLPIEEDIEGVFSITCHDIKILSDALAERKILSSSLWKKVLKADNEGAGMLYTNTNGYDWIASQFLGYGFYAYLDEKNDVSFLNVVNEAQKFKFVDNTWHYYRRDIRESVASLMTFPVDTKMIKLSKKNFWDATNIGIEKEQNNFVLDAKLSVAMGLMYPSKRVFVQTEGTTTIGLLVLNVDQKKDDYNIDIIIIDKRFQGKGYGKLMVKWAVDYLKEHGAKKLTIGVSRENIGAKKIYMNAGFEPNSVSGGGMELVMKL